MYMCVHVCALVCVHVCTCAFGKVQETIGKQINNYITQDRMSTVRKDEVGQGAVSAGWRGWLGKVLS